MIRQRNKADETIDPSTKTPGSFEQIDRIEQGETQQTTSLPYQPWLDGGSHTHHLMRSRSGENVNADQDATERVLLALKILTSGYEPNAASSVTQEEIDELEFFLGDEASGRSLDEIACLVIQREIRRQGEKRC